MIADRKEFEHSLKSLARMYDVRDKIAAGTEGDPETREDEVVSVVMMIRKIERELAEYLRAHPLTDEDYPEIQQAMARHAGRRSKKRVPGGAAPAKPGTKTIHAVAPGRVHD